MIGGFGTAGQPAELIDGLIELGVKGLTIINNNGGNGDYGLAKLLKAGAVRKIICSFPRQSDSWVFDELYRAGKIELELVPQGTLVERIRSGGMGLGGVLTPTGLGTEVEEGKQIVEVDGARFLLEKPLRADFALIAAWQADYVGNLSYLLTAHNFNPVMALAGDTVIAEPNAIVPVGVIPPDAVKTPGVLVDHLLIRAGSGGQIWTAKN